MSQYDYSVDQSDENSTHARQLRLIGSGKRVLEIGCGAGHMSRLLKERGCAVSAIEIDPDAARVASGYCDRIVIGNIDTMNIASTLEGESFQVVLLADVLEHLATPQGVLRQAPGLLSDDGYVVASVPNVAHGSIRLGLLQGRFDYTDWGLLDRTHLRFFSHDSLWKLFEDCGLRVEHFERITMDPFETEISLDAADFPPAVLERIYGDEEALTYQFVVVAVPVSRSAKVTIAREPPRVNDGASEPRGDLVGPVPESVQPVQGVRAIAFYLPQYHPTPENDAWWGRGFTEWNNVIRARPLFPGHYQPHLPADLGFYDLRLTEVRQAQAELAAAHGISGFCYHHYWFGGRRMLERPFDEVKATGKPEFPFALCWANEPWVRNWDSLDQDVLIRQTYSEAESRRHAQWLSSVFADPRYITVEGRPLFIVYRIRNVPDAKAYIERLKSFCIEAGAIEPYVVQVNAEDMEASPDSNGCDAEVEFPPHKTSALAAPRRGPAPFLQSNHVFEYEDVVAGHLDRPGVSWRRFPCVVPNWDNTPRRLKGGAATFADSTPALYESWLRAAAEREARRSGEGFVFINAWNEWAEGAHLEPDERWGRAYLEATARTFGRGSGTGAGSAVRLLGVENVGNGRVSVTDGASEAAYVALYERCAALESEAEAHRRAENEGTREAEMERLAAEERVAGLERQVTDFEAARRRQDALVAELRDREAEAASSLQYILGTRSFRYTASARVLYRQLREVIGGFRRP